MNSIKVNLTSKYFTKNEYISIIEKMLADLLQKHGQIPIGQYSNQVLVCECDQKASKLDSNGVEASSTIDGHHFYAFFSQHTVPSNGQEGSFSTDIMEEYLGIRKIGSCVLRLNKIGPNEYNATDCTGCNCKKK